MHKKKSDKKLISKCNYAYSIILLNDNMYKKNRLNIIVIVVVLYNTYSQLFSNKNPFESHLYYKIMFYVIKYVIQFNI